jgi:hypothetical protein
MNASLIAVLNDSERLLVAQTAETTGDRAMRTPTTVKRRASVRAIDARRQAKRDSR